MPLFQLKVLCICIALICIDVAGAREAKQYDFDIHADFRQAKQLTDDDDCIPIKVVVKQDKRLLRELSWRESPHQSNIKGDGDLINRNGEWRWRIPKKGGTLRYCMQLNHLRGERYDSRVTKSWALFRADDLLPPVASVAAVDSYSSTHLKFRLPTNWSSITAYPEVGKHRYEVDNSLRQFDRPTGWVQLGELGIRRDKIARTKVAVSAPIGQEVTRLEILTLLTFTLPTVRDWFPNFPERLLVASASDGLWRGALSGPASLYLHGERPLISENGTSTVLHELVHVGMQRRATDDADWIDEGLAEYLALVLLQEAGGLTQRRFQNALDDQRAWGASAAELGTTSSSGAATAKAVTLFAQLHREMGNEKFHQLVERLAKPGEPISAAMLREVAEKIANHKILSLP